MIYKYTLIYIAVIANLSLLAAQNDALHFDRRRASYDAFVTGKMENWIPIMQQIESIEYPTTDEQIELIRYYYGYSAYLVGMKDKKSAKSFVHKGDKLIKQILKEDPDNVTVQAFKGSFTGLKVVLNKFKMITLGPESIRSINRAYKADPENIQAITDKANLLYFTPGIFGGDKKESLAFFEKAITRMENEQDTRHSWFYLALMSLLAKQYENEGYHDKALVLQQKIHTIEPELKWLKEEILSKLDEMEED